MTTYGRYSLIRDEKGLSDYAVAKIAGIGRSTFTDWKSGRSQPKSDKMKKIAEALQVDVYDIVMNSEDMKETRERAIERLKQAKTNEMQKGFFIDADVLEMSEMARSKPGMKRLYKLAGKVDPKDFQLVEDFLKRITGADDNDYAE